MLNIFFSLLLFSFITTICSENSFIDIKNQPDHLKLLRTLNGTIIKILNGDKAVIRNSDEKQIDIVDLKNGETLFQLTKHTSKVFNTKITSDESKLATVDVSYNCNIWDINKGICLFAANKIPSIKKIIGEGNKLISYGLSSRESYDIWDLNEGKLLSTIEGDKACLGNPISALLLDSNRLLIQSDNQTIKVYDITTNQCTNILPHGDRVTSVASIDSTLVVTGVESGEIKLWNLNQNDCIKTVQGANKLHKMKVISNNKVVVTTILGNVELWDFIENKHLFLTPGHSQPIKKIIATPDKIITSSSDDTIQVWNLNNGSPFCTLKNAYGFEDVKIVNQGTNIISLSGIKDLELWDIKSGSCVQTIPNCRNSRKIIIKDNVVGCGKKILKFEKN